MNDTHHSIVERLSEYVDGELDQAERQTIDAHLASCSECRSIAADLREIASRAGSLVNTPPKSDLWPGVAARIGAGATTVRAFERRVRRRFSFTLPQLAAASVALMVLSGGMVWLARTGDPRADFPATSGAELPVVAPARLTDRHYDGAVEDLEEILERGRAQLDAETVHVLEQNLKAIDAAIEQCRQALERDPANTYLNNHLAAARQQKLALLRRATALTAGS